MTAPVPAVERAVRILERMAAAPRKRFTAAELASALGIHRATCFSIVSCLVSFGILDRDERKTYSLGRTLLRLGAATADQFPGVAEARRESFSLGNELDVAVLLCAARGASMLELERVNADTTQFRFPSRDQMVVPIDPPLGAIFVAWSSPEAIEEWLQRAPSTATPSDMEAFRRSVAAVRARGYSIGSETEVQLQLRGILARLKDQQDRDRLATALELADLVRLGYEDPRSDRSRNGQPIDHLIGPIFDESGQVAMTITVFGRAGQITTKNIACYAQPLLESCARITKASGGLQPTTPRTLGTPV